MSKRTKKLRGAVQKVIKPRDPTEPEKAEIDVEEADHLYREIRVENTLTNEKGQKRPLKQGEKVDIVIEADSDPNFRKE